jgi:hypothetical protein
LQRFFKTRNSDHIIEGLGELMALGVERAERGLEFERSEDKLVPEVTKIMRNLFDQGVRLAKLVNPELTPKGPMVTIGINGNASIGVGPTPQELASQAVAELEAAGYARDDIDMQMIQNYLSGQPLPPARRVIESNATVSRP